MKNKSMRGWIVMAAAFAAYQLLAFCLPFSRTAVFWIAYAFTDVALLFQLWVFKKTFSTRGQVRSKYCGMPVARMGQMYAGAQMLLGVLFMVLSDSVSPGLTVVAFVLLLAMAAVGVSVTEVEEEEAVQIPEDREAPEKAPEEKHGRTARLGDLLGGKKTHWQKEREMDACMKDLKKAMESGDTAAIISLSKKASQMMEEDKK